MNWIQLTAWFIAIVTVLFGLFPGVAAKSSKLDELRALQERSLIIEFTKSDYQRYVLDEPRDYNIIMYYTLSQKWDHCVSMESELSEVANSYINAKKHLVDPKDGSSIFFAKLEYSQDTEIMFQKCGFTSVPILALSKPEIARQHAEQKTSKYPKDMEWRLSSQDFFDAGKILEHVNKITNENVELKYTLLRIMQGNFLIFALWVLAFFFKDHIGYLLQQKVVWIAGTVVVFIMCVGGTAFNMIHKVPTFRYGHDASGNVVVEEYFQRNQRSQYAGEGYMVSMLIFIISLSMLCFIYAGNIKSKLNKEVIWMIIVLALYIMVLTLNAIFELKAASYNPTFFPPDHYQKGPLMFDQGTIISDV